jgi:hypothetical protein
MSNDNKVEVFAWYNEQAAKSEYDRWYTQLEKELSLKSVVFVLSETRLMGSKPKLPQPMSSRATDRDRLDHEKLTLSQQHKLDEFFIRCDTAIGIIRSSFKYGCKALQSIQSICNNAPTTVTEIDGIRTTTTSEWTSDLQVLAVLKHLKDNYSPSDSTDVNELRKQLSELRDTNGFYEFSQEFHRILGILKSTENCPDADTLREWAKHGITNERVRDHMCSNIFTIETPSPTYETIFKKIAFYLKQLGDDFDPYRTVKSGPLSKPLTSAMATNNITPPSSPSEQLSRCTRCFRVGHDWKQCNYDTCGACRAIIKGYKICTNAMQHSDPKMRFIPKQFRGKRPHELMIDNSPITNADPYKKHITKEQIKEAQRQVSALMTAFEKQKPDAISNEDVNEDDE